MKPTLLLPLDGSEKDGWALPVGATFAELAGTDIILVRVLDPSAESHVRRFAERMLHKAAEHVVVPAGRQVSCEIVDGDDVASSLLQMADERDVSLVVMATRAASGLERAVRGSVADRLVRECRRPIVVAPPGAHYMQDKQLHLRRALVPVDGSRASLSVISHLMSWPLAGELEIVLLQAVEPEPTGGYMMPVPMPSHSSIGSNSANEETAEWVHVNSERAEKALESVAARLRERFAAADVRVVERKDPAATILGGTRQELVDFIAMTTSGAGGLKRLLLGSVAEAVVRGSEVPVLLVTPNAQ